MYVAALAVYSIWLSNTGVITGGITGHNDYDAPATAANGESLSEKRNGVVTAETVSPKSAPDLHADSPVTKTMPIVSRKQQEVTEPPFWYPDLKPYAKRMARMRLERRLERIRKQIGRIVRWYGSETLAHLVKWPTGCETQFCNVDVDCCPGLYRCLNENEVESGNGRCVDKLTFLRHLEVAAEQEVASLNEDP